MTVQLQCNLDQLQAILPDQPVVCQFEVKNAFDRCDFFDSRLLVGFLDLAKEDLCEFKQGIG
jgi:hypothetical protein